MKDKARQAAQAFPGTIELCLWGYLEQGFFSQVAPQPP
jgi:hypothetical protein